MSIPIVNYLDLSRDPAQIIGQICDNCGARYLARRNGCGRCSGEAFTATSLPGTGTIKTFTVVWRSYPTVKTPFVSVLVDLGSGLIVKANLEGLDPADVGPWILSRAATVVTHLFGNDGSGESATTFSFQLVDGPGLESHVG